MKILPTSLFFTFGYFCPIPLERFKPTSSVEFAKFCDEGQIFSTRGSKDLILRRYNFFLSDRNAVKKEKHMTKLKIEWLKLDDIQIAYTQYGEGPDLLLLHGNSGSKKFFKQYQIEHFARYHTFALDSRGHGHSRPKDDAITYKQQVWMCLISAKQGGSQMLP